jgi:YHS domain-containing protein
MKINSTGIQGYSKILVALVLTAVYPPLTFAADPVQQFLPAKAALQPLPASQPFEGRGNGMHTCPVTGEKITNANFKADFYGRTVYFCCSGCLKSAKANPGRFVKPTVAEQDKAVQVFLNRAQAMDAAEFCND